MHELLGKGIFNAHLIKPASHFQYDIIAANKYMPPGNTVAIDTTIQALREKCQKMTMKLVELAVMKGDRTQLQHALLTGKGLRI